MTSKQRKHYETLKRRRDHLHERLSEDYRGNPEPTRRELSSLNWAIHIVESLERQGMLNLVAE